MYKSIAKIAVASAVVAMFAAFIPSASAQSWSMTRSRDNHDNNYRHHSSTWGNWRIRDDRDWNNRYRYQRTSYPINYSRYFSNNRVYLGYPYYRYVPYVYYQRHLPNFTLASTVVIVNRDNPADAVVIGNNYGYNRVVVLRVDSDTFWKIKNALEANDLSDFSWSNNVLNFRTSQGYRSIGNVFSTMP